MRISPSSDFSAHSFEHPLVAADIADRGMLGADASAVLRDIVATPISSELLPPDATGQIAQKTEDIIGPYDLHDFFLFHVLRNGFGPRKIAFLAERAFAGTFDRNTILKWLLGFYRRFAFAQFKRNASPDGPKVGSVALSQRGDWRMPSDISMDLWVREVKAMQQTLVLEKPAAPKKSSRGQKRHKAT